MANTAAMSLPLLAAEEDSEVTVAARGYSPPTPAPAHTHTHTRVEIREGEKDYWLIFDAWRVRGRVRGIVKGREGKRIKWRMGGGLLT